MDKAASLPSTLAATSPWGPGLMFSQCAYHGLSAPQLLCQQLGLKLPLSVQRAVAKHQAEYVAGRICARAAIEALQHGPVFPGMGPNRAPQWPAGLAGAITHADGQAAALVGLNLYWQGIGLDLERIIPEQEAHEIAGGILTPREQNRLSKLPASLQAQWITLVFSVKESLFKALFPLTYQSFYFHDAQLVNDHHIQLLISLSNQWKEGTLLRFNWRQRHHHLLSWVLIQAGQGKA
jgi:enterobactin synthetase component D